MALNSVRQMFSVGLGGRFGHAPKRVRRLSRAICRVPLSASSQHGGVHKPITTSEVIMNRKSRYLTRLSGLIATIVGMVYFTASQASAMRPDPGFGSAGGVPEGTGQQSVIRITDSSVSVLQWVLFAVVVIAALLVGAALTSLAQRSRTQLAH
jgi:hypothetical protein